MTSRHWTVYEPGDVLEYVHRGHAYVGRLHKAQRRAAVMQDPKGRLLTVPWTAVKGSAEGRKRGAHDGS